MNIKKILAIAIVVLAVFSCLSVASAGWFDFLTGEQFLQGDDAQVNFFHTMNKISALVFDNFVIIMPTVT